MKKLNSKVKLSILAVLTALILFLIYYFWLPTFNVGSIPFYFYLALVLTCIVSFVLLFMRDYLINRNLNKVYRSYKYSGETKSVTREVLSVKEYFSKSNLIIKSALTIFGSALLFVLLFALIGTKLFQAKAYAKQLDIREAPEEELMDTFNFNEGDVLLPTIDKQLAFKLAQASLGDYGAQYTIDYDNFTLISVHRNGKDELVRIAPLEYSNIFVAMSRYNEGTIGYIEVNVVTKETKLIEVKGGMKYMPSGVLSKDLKRHVRFKHPTELYGDYNFEIDDEGNPYWVIPTYRNRIGVINGPSPSRVITVDPITGKINKYKLGEEPKWIDRTIDSHMIARQATNALLYKNGFFNVHFGQKKDVFKLSEGYNYFIRNGETFYVSCITSPNESDETAIGFITINLKTKEASKYYFKGITENRAREIAMNDARVKAQNLDATWPILINYQGVETYFIVLKNDVQAQKIVLMNCKNGEHVAMGNTLDEAKAEYDKLLADSGSGTITDLEITGVVTNVRDLGNSIEFTLDGHNEKYFVVAPTVSMDARFIKVGDKITVKCKDYNNYYYVTSLKKIN